jgi:hypothetical protein
MSIPQIRHRRSRDKKKAGLMVSARHNREGGTVSFLEKARGTVVAKQTGSQYPFRQ